MVAKNKSNQAKTKEAEGQNEVKADTRQEGNGNTASCPLCGERSEEHAHNGATSLFKCSGCQIKFSFPRPSKDYLIIKRDNGYKDALIRPHAGEIREQSAAAGEIMWHYHRLTSNRPALLNAFGKTVLEIGCALGFRLRAFTKYGWTIKGVDSSKKAVEYAKACSLDVREEADSTIRAEQYDLIVLYGSLGQLADPRASMELISTLLKRQGLVYVHLERWIDGQFDELNLHDFSEEGAKKLFKESGFKMIDQVEDEAGIGLWFSREGVEKKVPADEEVSLEKPDVAGSGSGSAA